jgi:hypothetical protein
MNSFWIFRLLYISGCPGFWIWEMVPLNPDSSDDSNKK